MPIAVAVVYLAIGLAVYGRTLDAFFLSDDFYFLGIVSSASGMSVVFEPLVGRFVRPLVVALYYLNYRAFGLAPVPYHLSVLLPHCLASWLVFLIARRLSERRDDVWAFLAGLLFLVFAGHSEAVAWTAGAADTLVAPALLAAFYSYLRLVDPERPASGWWLGGFVGALVIAMLAKESWVVFPGLVVAHAFALGVPAGRRRRAAVLLAIAAGLVAGYLWFRWIAFGSVTGAYGGLASSAGQLAIESRAFLVRLFLPPGRRTALLWAGGYDLPIWSVAVIAIAVRARGHHLRLVIFALAAMLVALAPALPLTIALDTMESERFVYTASAFSCLLTVWSVRAVIAPEAGWTRRHAAAVVLVVCVAGAHAIKLVKVNGTRVAAAAIARSMTDSFAAQVVRHDPMNAADIYLLDSADNLGGAYVFRVGFNEAVRLLHPEAAPYLARLVCVATHEVAGAIDQAALHPRPPRGFDVDFAGNRIVQPRIPSSFVFDVSRQTRSGYAIDFTEALGRAVVLYLTGGRYELAGVVEGAGAPFGQLLAPSDRASCDGGSVALSGWALARDGRARVRIEAGTPPRSIGEVRWSGGMPPDIAGWYRAFPGIDRAGWTFDLPCEEVRRAGGQLAIRAVVENGAGVTRAIGERTVVAPMSGSR